MGGTFYFVHGTGVRLQGFDETMALIRGGIERVGLADVAVEGLCWGSKLGVGLDDQSLAKVLPVPVTKGVEIDEPSDAEVDAAIWSELLDDPLFELRLAAGVSGSGSASALPFPQIVPSQKAEEMLVAMGQRLTDPLPGGLLTRDLVDAADRLDRTILNEAAQSFADATHPDFISAIARALVASALSHQRLASPGTAPIAAYRRDERERLVLAVTHALSGVQPKSLGGDLLEKVKRAAKTRATTLARARRHALTGKSLPAIGDILYYQRRGATIVDALADDLMQFPRPIVAVGHSLGGIMLVDLLSRPGAPVVDRLVTVGSQSPLFFAIDALDVLRRSDSGSRPFTPWLNIFDRSDLLSFCAKPIFGDIMGIYDQEVSSGVPFPESHSAYWQLDDVFNMIAAFWPKSVPGDVRNE